MEPRIPGGYILLSRKLIESGIMLKPSSYLKVWIYLLIKAYHTPKNNLKRGQGFSSIPELQEVLSYYVGYRKEVPSKKKVWGIIEWLRNPYEGNHEGNTKETMIKTMKVTHGFVYTIVNYEYYQCPSNYEGNNESNYEGEPKEQREERQGNNKYKNVKNDKNERRKDLSDDIALQIRNLRLRYSVSQLDIIDQYLDILRWTRRNGKIADSVILKIYKEWEKFKPEKVVYALEVYINNPNFHDKKENYCYGIMRNTKDEDIHKGKSKIMSDDEYEAFLKTL